MRNIDTELDLREVTSIVRVSETVKVITQPSSKSMAHVAKPDSEWRWSDLQGYVVHEIERRFGSCARKDPKVEYGIFNSFVSRWGAKAPAIARYVFDVCGGYWGNEPVALTRFCKGSDPYFAVPISERLI